MAYEFQMSNNFQTIGSVKKFILKSRKEGFLCRKIASKLDTKLVLSLKLGLDWPCRHFRLKTMPKKDDVNAIKDL